MLTSTEHDETSKTKPHKRPTIASKDSGIKRAISGLIRRTTFNATLGPPVLPLNSSRQTSPDTASTLVTDHDLISSRHKLVTPSTSSTRGYAPPTPASPADPEPFHAKDIPTNKDFDITGIFNGDNEPSPPRISTGFSLMEKMNNSKLALQSHRPTRRLNRASSLESTFEAKSINHVEHNCDRNEWCIPAQEGAGFKARRISTSVPDDLNVDVVDLYEEYYYHNKLLGRRGKHLGKGATAHVKMMHRKGSSIGEAYAVKEFRAKTPTEDQADYERKIKSEFCIAKSVHHPNIIESFRLCTRDGRWNHVMECCENGDLFALVNQKYLCTESYAKDRNCLFKQVVQGLTYLHANGIAHRDVKLENLLITRNSKLKITDFGVSEVFSGIHPGMRSAGGECGRHMNEVKLCSPGICGSPPYVAPEVIAREGPYDPRPLDVWGAAVVMLCLCFGGNLWNEARTHSSSCYDDLIRGWNNWNDKHAEVEDAKITETDYPYVKCLDQKISPPALRRLLLNMLNPEPEKRITMEGVAENRWLKGVECCQMDTYDEPTIITNGSKIPRGPTRVITHNHMPPPTHLGHMLIRSPG